MLMSFRTYLLLTCLLANPILGSQFVKGRQQLLTGVNPIGVGAFSASAGLIWLASRAVRKPVVLAENVTKKRTLTHSAQAAASRHRPINPKIKAQIDAELDAIKQGPSNR